MKQLLILFLSLGAFCTLWSQQNKAAGIKLVDKQVYLSTTLVNSTENIYFALDEDDTVMIKCNVLNKGGIAYFSLVAYSSGTVVFKKDSFNTLTGKPVVIPKKGIYCVVLSTNSYAAKQAKLLVVRIPAKASVKGFNTTVREISDTTGTEILNTNMRVYSRATPEHDNKIVQKITLPANTSYWVYWFGVGAENIEKMKMFSSGFSGMDSLNANPLYQFGMKKVASLPGTNTGYNINYEFADKANAELFASRNKYTTYSFGYGNSISSDYALVRGPFPDLNICFSNSNSEVSENLELMVMAFTIKKHLEMEQK